LSFNAIGAHLVGGELFYRCLGGNEYEITMKIYRDCGGVGAPFDPLAKVGVFNANDNSLYTMLLMPFPGSDTVPINNVSGCFTLPPNLCLEAAFYVDTITLPPIVGGYNIVYQRCCRNPTIVNLTNPGNWGSTYTSYIPMVSIDSCIIDSTLALDTTCTIDTTLTTYDTTCTIDSVCSPTCVYDTTCLYDTNYALDTTCTIDSSYLSNTTCYYDTMCNSSPYFNNFPPVVLCINDVINFDHSATDLDGDRLTDLLADISDPLRSFGEKVANYLGQDIDTKKMWNDMGYTTGNGRDMTSVMHRIDGPPIHEQTLGSADAMLLRLLDGDEWMKGAKQPYDPRIHFVLIRDAYIDANPKNTQLHEWLENSLNIFDEVYSGKRPGFLEGYKSLKESISPWGS